MKTDVIMRSIAILLVTGWFVACSSDEEGAPKTITQAEQGVVYDLDLAGGLDEERSLTFNTETVVPDILETSNWTTHVFFRKEGDNSFVGYAQIDWTVTGRTSGKIQLRQKNTRITLHNTKGLTPRSGETWYVAGIAGGGKLNAAKNEVSFAPDASIDNTLKNNQLRVPLMFAWTKLKIVENAADQAAVTFKVQGTLLHLHLDNKSYIHTPSEVKLTSNLLDSDGKYSFVPSGAVRAGSTPTWSFAKTANTASLSVKIPRGKDVSGHSLVWGMPRTGVTSPVTKIQNLPLKCRLYNKGTTTEYSSTATFRTGRAYQVHLEVYRPWLPLDYVAPRNVAENKTSFVTTDRNNAPAFMATWDESVAVKISGYHLPTADEWGAVIPTVVGVPPVREIELSGELRWNGTYPPSPKMTTYEDTGTSGVRFQNNLYEKYASYAFADGGRTVYVLWRISATAADAKAGHKHIACKYQLVGTLVEGNLDSHTKITCRYLGDSFTGRITDINKDAFWNANNSDDVVRIFPHITTTYNENDNTQSKVLGVRARFWNATSYTLLGRQKNGAVIMGDEYLAVWTNSYLYKDKNNSPVRLFRDKL